MSIWPEHRCTPLKPARPRPVALGAAATLALLLSTSATAWQTTTSAPFDPVPQIASELERVEDPPGRAGRLAEVQGSVWLFHPEAGEWMAAQRNRPLTTGDRLSTDADGRLAVQIGSTRLVLDGNTELEILRLDDERVEVDLRGGSLGLRLRSDEAAREWLVLTPEGRLRPLGAGRLRVDRSADLSQLTVWEGQARYEGPQSALNVSQGQRADFWLDRQGVAQYSLGAPRLDGFERWVAELDRDHAQRQALRHVSPEMTGAEDLERHGRWEQDPEYGPLWQPHEVPVGWAPYAAGHWAWVAPWGWTWVDDAPWGFAPFHYGRWVHVRNRWCWTPGRYVARPVYAPALVGWVGGHGGNVSVTIGGGPAVGWFPLGPREAYVPYRKVSPRYVRVVNGPHFRHGGDIERLIQSPATVLRGAQYSNRKFHHGTTSVPVQAFQQRGRIAPVRPEWRGGAVAREFDRRPATPIGAVGRPEGARPGPPPGWRVTGERRESPTADWPIGTREARQPGWPAEDRPGRGVREPREPRAGQDGPYFAEPRAGRDGRDWRPPGDPREGRAPRGEMRPPAPAAAPAVMPVAPVAPVMPPAMPVAPPVMAAPAPARGIEASRDWANGRNRPEREDRGAGPPFGRGVDTAVDQGWRPGRAERPAERIAPQPASMPPVAAPPRAIAPPAPPVAAPAQAPTPPEAAPRPRNPRDAFDQRQPGPEPGRERRQQL